MDSASRQLRLQQRAALRGWPLLLAVLLTVLQAATPFAHAMEHAFWAQDAGAQRAQTGAPGWSSLAPEEKPCALCAADHLPALPEQPPTALALVSRRTDAHNVPIVSISSAPLDLFCRPPPSR